MRPSSKCDSASFQRRSRSAMQRAFVCRPKARTRQVPLNTSMNQTFPLKRRAANKPDSVLPRRPERRREIRSFISAINPKSHGGTDSASRTGRTFDFLFDLAPRRVYPARGISPVAGGLLPRPFTITLAGCLSLWHFPSRGISPHVPPLTSGSSALRSPDFPLPLRTATGHSRVASGETVKELRATDDQSR